MKVAGAASRDLRPRRTLHTLLSQTLRDWSQRAVNTDRAKSHRLWSHKSRPQPRGRDTYKLTSPGPFFSGHRSENSPIAVMNAIVDALAELGVRHIEMPVTPERVWRAAGMAREGPKVCRLAAGGRWIRTCGPAQKTSISSHGTGAAAGVQTIGPQYGDRITLAAVLEGGYRACVLLASFI